MSELCFFSLFLFLLFDSFHPVHRAKLSCMIEGFFLFSSFPHGYVDYGHFHCRVTLRRLDIYMTRYDTHMASFACKRGQQESRNEGSTLGIVLFESCTSTSIVPSPIHPTRSLNTGQRKQQLRILTMGQSISTLKLLRGRV